MKKRHSAEQIINKLRQAEVELAKGVKIPQVCRKLARPPLIPHTIGNPFTNLSNDNPLGFCPSTIVSTMSGASGGELMRQTQEWVTKRA